MAKAKHNTMSSFYDSRAGDSARKQNPSCAQSKNGQDGGVARLTKKNLQVFSKNFQGRKGSQLSQRSLVS